MLDFGNVHENHFSSHTPYNIRVSRYKFDGIKILSQRISRFFHSELLWIITFQAERLCSNARPISILMPFGINFKQQISIVFFSRHRPSNYFRHSHASRKTRGGHVWSNLSCIYPCSNCTSPNHPQIDCFRLIIEK